MKLSSLELLECPFCAGRLTVDERTIAWSQGDVSDAILRCDCNVYPVVSGIPYLRSGKLAKRVVEHVLAGEFETATAVLLKESGDTQKALEVIREYGNGASYKTLLYLLCKRGEADYLFYRFSDPTFLVGRILLWQVARQAQPGSVLDFGGGTGQFAAEWLTAVPTAHVWLADVAFFKLWLARRFVSPDAEAVCCDGNAPLPFARRAFDAIFSSDALHLILSRRLVVSEFERTVKEHGTILLSHTHNALRDNPTPGMPLTPDGYRHLFTRSVTLFSEASIRDQWINENAIDLSASGTYDEVQNAHALALIAQHTDDVLDRLSVQVPSSNEHVCVNPIYRQDGVGDQLRLVLTPPSDDYAREFGEYARYLPTHVDVPANWRVRLERGDSDMTALFGRGVFLNLPPHYV